MTITTITEASVIGIRECLKCRWLFVSQDIVRLRRCDACKKSEDEYQPRHVADVNGDVGLEQQDTS